MTRHDDIEDARTDALCHSVHDTYQHYVNSLDDGEEPLEYNDPDWRDTREADIPRRQ